MKESHRYDDIIGLPHHVSASHPQMPLSERAAQFSPFAALTGHKEAIKEAARLTEEWIEPDEDRKKMLDERLRILKENLKDSPEVAFTYYRPDEKKSGGAYITVTGIVKKIREYEHKILLEDGTVIPIQSLSVMEGALFRKLDEL